MIQEGKNSRTHHRQQVKDRSGKEVTEQRGGLKGQYEIESKENTSPKDFLSKTENLVSTFLSDHPQSKIQIRLICEMMKVDLVTGAVSSEQLASFNSWQESIFTSTDVRATYQRMITKILEAFATYLKNLSGWRLKRVIRLEITVSSLRPIRGSSYIPLLKEFTRTKGSAMPTLLGFSTRFFRKGHQVRPCGVLLPRSQSVLPPLPPFLIQRSAQ